MSIKVIGRCVIYKSDPIDSSDSICCSDSDESGFHEPVPRKSLFRESKSEILHLVSEFFGYHWDSRLLCDVIYDYKPYESLYDWIFTYNSVMYCLHYDLGCITLYRPCECSYDCEHRSSRFCPVCPSYHHCSFMRGLRWISVNYQYFVDRELC